MSDPLPSLSDPNTPAVVKAEMAALRAAPEATRFALAVAAYGQMLRGDPWLAADFGWDDIVTLAKGAKGEDEFGLRGEFVQLVRDAATAKSVNE